MEKYSVVLSTNSSILSDFNQFTGFEHTRFIALLTVMSLVSITIWITVGAAILISQISILYIRFLRYRLRVSMTEGKG